MKAKYQPRIKEQKDVIAVQEYELEKLEQQYQKDMLDLDDWKKKAEANVLPNSGNWKRKSNASPRELKEIDGKLNNLNREKSEKLNQLKQEWNRVQQDIAHEKDTQAGSIRLEDKEEQQRIATEKAEYERQMKQELHSQGPTPNVCNRLAVSCAISTGNCSSSRSTPPCSSSTRRTSATSSTTFRNGSVNRRNRNASSARKRTTCDGKPRVCRSRLMP